ncbi:hypothetical protein X798_04753 [Onchocerca flexuosa]|uniref:Uncharacterized protein n=1 Tax=Onchocerca flexuosa TaxID=387005 RepID=A0A238BTH1_9BILA|nr:hypothetical protein X798_04753 [Onchocerca flexuosa]
MGFLILSFKPTHLTVECESRNHAGQVDDERHFFVQIASNNFEGLQAIQVKICVKFSKIIVIRWLALPVHTFITFMKSLDKIFGPCCINFYTFWYLTRFSVLQMHRLINNCLREELAGPVHALRIDAYATSKFSNNPPTIPPKCAQNHTDHFST